MANAVLTLDLSCVQKKVTLPMDEGGYDWPQQEAAEAIAEYRDFLQRILDARTAGDPPADPHPDPVVDIIWHTHILFTRKYHEDCQNIFGEYLHHEPKL